VTERHGRTVGPTSWVRARLRAAPGAALLAAALVFVTAFLATALPRALDRSADGALRALVGANGPTAGALVATATPLRGNPDLAADLDTLRGTVTGRVSDPLRLAPGRTVTGSRTLVPRPLLGAGLPRPGGEPPELGLFFLDGAERHAQLAAGRWPGGSPTASGSAVEVALAEPTAAVLGLRVGSVIDGGTALHQQIRATVVGLFRATDPQDPFWSGTACLTAPCPLARSVQGETVPYWLTGALIGRGRLAALSWWSDRVEDFVQVPLDPAVLRADRTAALRRTVGALLAGPEADAAAAESRRSDLHVTSALPALLTLAENRRAAAAPLTALGPVGAAGVALAVLCLAAALAVERRTAELHLLRARGASRAALGRRLLAEGTVTVLPAAAAATVLALAVLPTPRWGAAVAAGGATAVVALLALPVRALLALPADARRGARQEAAAQRSGRRRAVVEAAVAAVTVAALVAARRRGVAPGGGVDPLLVAAPLLIALSGALLLARCWPALAGLAARRAARGRGPVAFLGLARAARGSGGRRGPSVLPLLALLLAVTTAGFGATVLTALHAGQQRAALTAVGADAVVSTPGDPLPAGFAERAAALPGVVSGLPAWRDGSASMATADRSLFPNVTVLVVDPVRYAALAERSGTGRFDPALLAARAADGTVPVLVTPGLAARLDDSPSGIHLGPGEIEARMVGVVDGAVGVGGGEIAVLPAAPAAAALPAVGRPNLWFGTGRIEPGPLGDLLRRLDPAAGATSTPAPWAGPAGYHVATAAEEARGRAAPPAPPAAARVFDAAVLAADAFALLAVLLTLVRATPERTALLARLRTMGLRPRAGLALILAEALPQALAAAGVGAALAAVAALVLGPAVDLAAVIGAPVHATVAFAAGPVAVQALALAAAAAAAVFAEAAYAARRQISTELRAGDDR
jgi:putative ABC transport system permease protein